MHSIKGHCGLVYNTDRMEGWAEQGLHLGGCFSSWLEKWWQRRWREVHAFGRCVGTLTAPEMGEPWDEGKGFGRDAQVSSLQSCSERVNIIH